MEQNHIDCLNKIVDEIFDKKNETFSFSKENLEIAITTQLKKVMQMACDMSPFTHLAVITLSILLMIKQNTERVVLPTIHLSNKTNAEFLDSIYNNVVNVLSKEFYLSLRIAERQWK